MTSPRVTGILWPAPRRNGHRRAWPVRSSRCLRRTGPTGVAIHPRSTRSHQTAGAGGAHKRLSAGPHKRAKSADPLRRSPGLYAVAAAVLRSVQSWLPPLRILADFTEAGQVELEKGGVNCSLVKRVDE